MRFMALAILSPEVFQLLADNVDALDWLDAAWKGTIRLSFLLLAFLSRPWKQITVSPEPDTNKPPQ